MSTYSPNLRLELITSGTQAGAWGNTTNTNLGSLLDPAISGFVAVAVTSAAQAFTALYGAADEARNAIIELNEVYAGDFAVYAPPSPKTYIIYNSTSYNATIYNSTVLGNTTAAGGGVLIKAGATTAVWSDGTSFALQFSSQTLYPIGSIYINADDSTNPSTLFGFGTWVTFGGGQVPVGYLSGSALPFGTGGTVGGSADTVVVTHTHTQVAHTHTGTTAAAGSHTHNLNTTAVFNTEDNSQVPVNSITGDNNAPALAAQAGLQAINFLTTAPAHTHTFTTDAATPTNNSEGVTGVNQNYQPYITVYMWRRTA
jgi:hypothetical protein